MAGIKKHWHQGLLATATLVGIIFALILTSPTIRPIGALAQVAETSEGTSPDVYFAVEQIRRDLALTDQDLAAMGCSGETVEAVLSALIAWRQGNAATLRGINLRQREAKAAVAREIRARQSGKARSDSRQLIAQSCEASISAAQDRRQLLAGAVAAVEPVLTAEQRTIWSNARANRHLPRRFRYISGITRQQCADVGAARRAALASRQSTETAEAQVLYGSQLTEQAQAQARIASGLSAVQEAVENVLPLPAQVLAERAMDVYEQSIEAP